MSLKLLMIEEDPADILGEDVGHIVLAGCEEPDVDMELPDDFIQQDDLDLLEDSATALESIGGKIACEGMDLSTARELEKVSPGYMRRAGGHAVFTHRPSLEGLAEAQASVAERFKQVLSKLRDYVVALFKRFSAWLKTRFARPELQDLSQDINEFVAVRNNRNAIAYLSGLPHEVEESADEVARFMDGDTKQFAAALVDQFASVTQRVQTLEKAMQDNPVHFRLAKGIVGVKDLFEETASSAMGQALQEGAEALEHIVTAKSEDAFMQGVRLCTSALESIKHVEENLTVNSQASSELGDDKEVPLEKLFDNVRQAGEDMKRVSVQQQVADMQKSVELIISSCEDADVEQFVQGIPKEIPQENHAKYAAMLSTLLREQIKLGQGFLRLWRARADAVGSINSVGKGLVGLVDGFQRAVAAAGSSLTPEQKAQLSKALVGKGLKVDF